MSMLIRELSHGIHFFNHFIGAITVIIMNLFLFTRICVYNNNNNHKNSNQK